MKLTKHQFCKAVDTYKEMLNQEHQIIDILDICPEWAPGAWINNYYEFLSDMCDLEENPIYGTTLDWFCFETDFGQKTDYNKIYDINTNRTWRIESPETLYDYIMEVEKEEY